MLAIRKSCKAHRLSSTHAFQGAASRPSCQQRRSISWGSPHPPLHPSRGTVCVPHLALTTAPCRRVTAMRAQEAPTAQPLSPQQQQQQQPDQQQQQGEPGPPRPQLLVRPVLDQELRQVAQLRAEAYFESDTSRFAPSFKRQFADQEVESLRQRARGRGEAPPRCDCLVALDATSNVIGCIDIRLPQSVTGVSPSGVPPGDTGGAYLYNLVVAEHLRGSGVGKALMAAGMEAALGRWGAGRLYTQVAADNEVAYGLYRSFGFVEHSQEATLAPAVTLGRLVLLVVEAEAARQQLQKRQQLSSTADAVDAEMQPAPAA